MTVPLRNRYLDHATPFVAEWTSVSKLQARKDAWRRLSANAIDPNPFYSPEYLAASVALEGADIRCIAIYRDGSRDSDLLGLFPLQRARVFDGALIPAFEFYFNDFICLTAPLVDKDAAEAVWACFFDRCAHTPGEPHIILSRLSPATGPGYDAWHTALTSRGLAQCEIARMERAVLHKPATFNDAFRRIPSGRRGDLRRRRRRLRIEGVSETLNLRYGDPRCREALEAFFRIEAAGWKGSAGTAMACSAEMRAFAEAVFLGPDAEFNVLTFNGEPISVDCLLVSQGVVSTVKVAYDEKFANYSPGLLAGVHAIRHLVQRPDYVCLDSCAAENHVFNDLWNDRRQLVWSGFTTSADVPAARLDQLARLAASARRLRSWLREMLSRS